MMKLTKILASAALFFSVFAHADNRGLNAGFREAMRLYDKEMYSRSKMVFDEVASDNALADPAGYSLLCDVKAAMPGYTNSIETYISEYPYSILIPQIKFYHALNLFDAQDYTGASKRSQRLRRRIFIVHRGLNSFSRRLIVTLRTVSLLRPVWVFLMW